MSSLEHHYGKCMARIEVIKGIIPRMWKEVHREDLEELHMQKLFDETCKLMNEILDLQSQLNKKISDEAVLAWYGMRHVFDVISSKCLAIAS